MTTGLWTPAGTIYGAALNDAALLEACAADFAAAPYNAPPKAPVLYIKPRNCVSNSGAPIPLPADLTQVRVSATIAVLFARDLGQAQPGDVRAAIGAACLALDVSADSADFYRPAIREQCRDGFLPLGRFAELPKTFGPIVTTIDSEVRHEWSLDRLVRPLEQLCAELSAFMTLRAGDLLLLGVAADAPLAAAGQSVRVQAAGLPDLAVTITPEIAP